MAALVDEAALRIVHRLLGPAADQVVVDGRAARGAAVRCLPVQVGIDPGNGKQLATVGQRCSDRFAHGCVAMLGAAAHGLGLGRGGVVATGGEHQNLFHQAGAGPAGRAGLGVLAHLLDGEQTLLLDGLADGALGHAIATAHFRFVGHAGGLAVALVADVADIAFAKHQLVADVGNAAAVAQQLEVPAAVHGVTIHAGTD